MQDGYDLIWIGEPKLEAAKKLQRQPEGRGGTCVEESSNQKNVGWQNQPIAFTRTYHADHEENCKENSDVGLCKSC